MNDLLMSCLAEGSSLGGLLTHNDGPVDGAILLWAIAGLESSFGRDRESARYEPAYARGGRYGKAPDQQARLKRYGALAACSYGSFQVMYTTACELGFTGKPWELIDDAVCARYASKFILTRSIRKQGATTLAQILDAYNSGTHKDAFTPAAYVHDGILLFERGLPAPQDPAWTTQPPPPSSPSISTKP